MNVSERAKPYRKQRGRNCNSVRILHESSASHSRQEIRNKQQKNSIEITIALRSSNLLLHAAKKKEFEEKRKKNWHFRCFKNHLRPTAKKTCTVFMFNVKNYDAKRTLYLQSFLLHSLNAAEPENCSQHSKIFKSSGIRLTIFVA